MAEQIDQLPYYDPLVKNNLKMSDVWVASMSSFIESLNGYLSDFGMFMPQLTTAERDSIQAPVSGQLIYNTDSNTAEYFKPGSPGTWNAF